MLLVSSCSCLCQSIEAKCLVENEDVVGGALTGDAPTTSEWSTILLPNKMLLILDVWQYILVSHNVIILYLHLPYFCISNSALFFAKYSGTLLYIDGASSDTFYYSSVTVIAILLVCLLTHDTSVNHL